MCRTFGELLRGFLLCGLLCFVSVPCSADQAHPANPTEHAGHDDGHGADAHGGKAQVPMDFQSDLGLWSLVTFAVFLFVLGKIAWQPLLTGLNQREAGIRKEIADAESNRLKSETLLRDYEARLAQAQDEVKAIIAEARRDAEHVKQDIVTTAQREAEATRQRALADIERARDAALNEMFEFMSKNVVQATEQVLQRNLTGDDHERLVREALSQMDVRKN